MKFKLKFKKNPHQKEFFADDISKFLHLSAGFGAGKSYGLIMKLLKLSYLNQGIDGGLVCPTFKDFKKDIYPLISQILEDNKIIERFHKTDHTYSFPWTSGKVYVVSAENSLRGPNWGFCGINELTLMPLTRYREAIGRVRIKNAKFPQIVSCGTPEGIASPYYEVFTEKPWRGARILFGSTDDNKENLADDYIQSLEDSYDKFMLDAYRHGLWVNMTGNRHYWSYRPEKNDDKTITRDESLINHVSMDFNVDPMTCAIWQQPHQFSIKCVEEIVITSGSDTSQIADALLSRGYKPDNTIIYPDPAGLARSTKGLPDVTILRNKGFHNIRVKTSHPRIRQRQLTVNNLLDKLVVKINPDKAPWLKKDLIAVETDQVTGEKKKANKNLTHLSDGMDYMLDILYPLSGHKPSIKSEIMR